MRQIHTPDPAWTGSERARENFRLAIRLALALVGLMWLIQILGSALDVGPDTLGVRPREWWGLAGILFAPLVHGGFEHLIANTAPLLVMLTTMLYLYPHSSLRVLPAIWIGPGIAVWLFGRDSVHVGSSGLIYGLVAYVLVAGLLRSDRRAVAAAVAVFFLYGTMVWGVLPLQRGVSWETHLAAAVIGAAMAIALRKLDVPPRKIYAWEDEEDVDFREQIGEETLEETAAQARGGTREETHESAHESALHPTLEPTRHPARGQINRDSGR